MTSRSDLYRKLCRLKAKRSRLQARITALETKLAGKTYFWGQCTRNKKR